MTGAIIDSVPQANWQERAISLTLEQFRLEIDLTNWLAAHLTPELADEGFDLMQAIHDKAEERFDLTHREARTWYTLALQLDELLAEKDPAWTEKRKNWPRRPPSSKGDQPVRVIEVHAS